MQFNASIRVEGQAAMNFDLSVDSKVYKVQILIRAKDVERRIGG